VASRRVAAATLSVAVLVGAAAALLLVPGRSPDPAPAPARAPSVQPPPPVSRVPPARGPVGARLLRRVQLRARPDGRVVRTLGVRTGYGSQRILAVVARRPGWLGVLSDHMPNSRAGWIPAVAAKLRAEPYTLHVDLSARELVVRRRRHAVRRIALAVGRTGSATPTGRFAITDALRMGRNGGPYGCCALALTGRQPNLPQGWNGGDRLAIHGTASEAELGAPVSAGCLRASNRDMRWMMARVPLGATVRIRA
jgi:lipoprotein-anchoring transpeptidase ErfK/SrfK